MFKFGENWASFSRQLDQERIEAPVSSLAALFGADALRGRSFFDIGGGSGLFSIAAARGINVDQVSVRVSTENAGRWLEVPSAATFPQGSALDDAFMASLGKFDVVYS